ncbi:PREDICTED: cyclin-D1-1 [Tarenaya hassleriana]|uniref:cyclin-D1-1 n=1 Tax=Tarenaya hassleriana TaxID=28532 RepID=UPI00053C4035|nr:PREDICTED: cyclin-D1-1 [Tarenaya hassleriana]
MSVAFSVCSDDLDLLCGEDSGVLSGESTVDSASDDADFSSDESIAAFIEDERHFVPGLDYLSRFQSQSLDASAREEAVSWILKVKAFYNFQPLTAYLAVNYMDRFLYARRLPQTNGWPMQLLAVACLSLAAKLEELLVPSLLCLQVEGTKYVFQPKTIQRMELLVLSILDWRLRSVTPFSFLTFFACKISPSGTFLGLLVSRATDIILSNMQETCFVEYWPSSIAAAAILCVADELPILSSSNRQGNPEAWCHGLSQEKVVKCYRLMQAVALDGSRRKGPRVIPQLRVTVRTSTVRPSDPSSLFSSPDLSPYKRRKLNNCLWVEGDDEATSQ